MSETPAHSPLGASGTHRWFHCQASVRHTAETEERPSEYALEGTRAHELASEWLKTGEPPLTEDRETFDAIHVYVNYCNRLKGLDWSARFYVEQQFRLEEIEDDIPMFGTADFVAYHPKTRHLHIVDYKHGVGLPVDIYQNTQLLYYALGVWYVLGRRGVKQLTLTIVQPRAFHPDGPIRTWTLSIDELVRFEDELIEAVERVRRYPDRYEPGIWCQFCPVAGACRAHMEYALSEEIDEMSKVDPGLLDDEDLAEALRKSKPLSIWLTRFREEALARAEVGKLPPGTKLVAGKTRRVWRDPDEAGDRMMNQTALAEDEIYTTEVLSPAKLEALIGKENMGEFNDLIDYVSGKPQLVDIDDPRDAVGSGVDYATKDL